MVLFPLCLRKPTHTGKYLDFSSHHPLTQKAAVVRTLFNRENSLSSSTADVREEKVRICDSLKANHSPGSFINRVSWRKPSTSPLEEQHFQKTIVLPYVRGVSEAIKRAFSLVNIRVVFRPNSTLRQQLVNIKDRIPPEKRANIVYSIPCRNALPSILVRLVHFWRHEFVSIEQQSNMPSAMFQRWRITFGTSNTKWIFIKFPF